MRLFRFLVATAFPLVAFVTGCGAAAGETASNGAASAVSTADDDGGTLPAPSNFAWVRDGLYRGGHPDHANLLFLQSLGVKTIVDLELGDFIEATPQEISQEVNDATAMGFKVVREPLSAFQPFVSDAEMDRTLTLLSDEKNGTVYVHCKHGQDRTGMVIGLERVLIENWSQDDAYGEMLAYGFHPFFLGLKAYYFDKTEGHAGDDDSDGGAR